MNVIRAKITYYIIQNIYQYEMLRYLLLARGEDDGENYHPGAVVLNTFFYCCKLNKYYSKDLKL